MGTMCEDYKKIIVIKLNSRVECQLVKLKYFQLKISPEAKSVIIAMHTVAPIYLK